MQAIQQESQKFLTVVLAAMLKKTKLAGIQTAFSMGGGREREREREIPSLRIARELRGPSFNGSFESGNGDRGRLRRPKLPYESRKGVSKLPVFFALVDVFLIGIGIEEIPERDDVV